MKPKDALAKLHTDGTFSTWRGDHPDTILAHIFLESDNIQIGYFDPVKNNMTTFVLGEELKMIPDQEILKGNSEIQELDINEVIVSPQEALEAADALRKTHYTDERVLKSLSILQNFDGSCVYNITYFTMTFKTVNIKVSAIDASIINHSIGSLAGFDKKA